MKKQIIIALATLTALPAVSQEKWDLRKCIDYAIEHNLSIKQQEAARDQNAVDLNTAKYSRLPNLNGNVGQSFNFGRALQADNTYGDRNTKNTNFSLSTSIPLFRIANTEQHRSQQTKPESSYRGLEQGQRRYQHFCHLCLSTNSF